MLNENALAGPMCGLPSRLNSTRSIAFASVAVPTVERELAPMRSWSTMIAVVSPSSTSTSGRPMLPMNPCTNARVGLVDQALRLGGDGAEHERLDLPDPLTPVNTVRRRFGMSTLMFFRLFSRAPCTRIRSWLSAAWSFVGMLRAYPADTTGG